MLLFGVDRLVHFPDAWIQAGRFAGTDRAAILDHAELRTPLIRAVEDAVAFVGKYALHGVSIGPVRREWFKRDRELGTSPFALTTTLSGVSAPSQELLGRHLAILLVTASRMSNSRDR